MNPANPVSSSIDRNAPVVERPKNWIKPLAAHAATLMVGLAAGGGALYGYFRPDLQRQRENTLAGNLGAANDRLALADQRISGLSLQYTDLVGRAEALNTSYQTLSSEAGQIREQNAALAAQAEAEKQRAAQLAADTAAAEERARQLAADIHARDEAERLAAERAAAERDALARAEAERRERQREEARAMRYEMLLGRSRL